MRIIWDKSHYKGFDGIVITKSFNLMHTNAQTICKFSCTFLKQKTVDYKAYLRLPEIMLR